MKLAWLLLLTAASLGAQTTNLYTSGLMPHNQWDQPKAGHPILMAWITNEKCNECNTQYLMVCGDNNPDCNTPLKGVIHYGWFKTTEEALKTAEDAQWEVMSVWLPAPIQFTRTETEEHTPKPDDIKKIVHYQQQEPSRVGPQ